MNSTTELFAPVKRLLGKDLQDLISHNRGVRAALLASIDGFEVAYAGDLNCSPSNLAAMASSMLSLSIAMANETSLDPCKNLVIEAQQGRMLVMSVPSEKQPMILTVLTKEDVSFGQLLLDAKITVRQLSIRLEDS